MTRRMISLRSSLLLAKEDGRHLALSLWVSFAVHHPRTSIALALSRSRFRLCRSRHNVRLCSFFSSSSSQVCSWGMFPVATVGECSGRCSVLTMYGRMASVGTDGRAKVRQASDVRRDFLGCRPRDLQCALGKTWIRLDCARMLWIDESNLDALLQGLAASYHGAADVKAVNEVLELAQGTGKVRYGEARGGNDRGRKGGIQSYVCYDRQSMLEQTPRR